MTADGITTGGCARPEGKGEGGDDVCADHIQFRSRQFERNDPVEFFCPRHEETMRPACIKEPRRYRAGRGWGEPARGGRRGRSSARESRVASAINRAAGNRELIINARDKRALYPRSPIPPSPPFANLRTYHSPRVLTSTLSRIYTSVPRRCHVLTHVPRPPPLFPPCFPEVPEK